jgi:heat shock 70kDa protein 4
MVIYHQKENAEKTTKVRVADSVVSVPGFWNDTQRRAMLDATRIAGLTGARLINDLTAVAINYGLYKSNLPAQDAKAHHAMFVDVGDSHVSASIVAFWDGKMKVLAQAHDSTFGGLDFDIALATHCANEFLEKKKLDVRTNAKAWYRLVGMANKTKCNLNHQPQASVNVESVMNDEDMSIFLTRDTYQSLVKNLAERVLAPLKQVMEMAGMTSADLAAIELVGSATRTVVIQQQLQQFLGKELSTTMNAEEAVCKGCALYAAMISPKFKVKEYKIEDTQLYPIELSWHTIDDPADTKESQLEVFKANSAIPSGKHATFNRPDSRPFQITVRYTHPEAANSKNPVLANFTIRNIPKPKNPSTEVPEVRIKVKINTDGVLVGEAPELREVYEEEIKEEKKDEKKDEKKADEKDKMDVDAPADAMQTDDNKEKKTKKKIRWVPLTWEAKYTSGMDDVTIATYLSLEEAMQRDVNQAVALSDARNAVEAYVYTARDKLHSIWSEYASDAEKTKFGKELDETENWLYEEGSEDQTSKSIFEKKMLELKAMGDPLALRLSEFETRPKAVGELNQLLSHYEKCATESIDLYEHIKPEDKKKIADEVAKIRQWLSDITAKQSSLKKTDDPVLLSKNVSAKCELLKSLADPILAQPKPKPAPKPAEPAPAPAPASGDAPADAAPKEAPKDSATPAPDTMDIDP